MKKRVNKRWFWIVIGVILVAAIGGGVAVAISNNNGNNEVNEEEVVETEEEDSKETEGVETEEISDEKLRELEEQGGKQKVPQYDGEDPNSSDSLTGVIVYTGTAMEKWMVRVNIDQYLADGQCELNIYQGGNIVYTETTNIMADVSTSTCEGFDVDLSKMPRGAVDVKIKLNSGGKTGLIEGEASI